MLTLTGLISSTLHDDSHTHGPQSIHPPYGNECDGVCAVSVVLTVAKTTSHNSREGNWPVVSIPICCVIEKHAPD